MEITDSPRRASEALRHGHLAVLPTETVYGLAARADLPGSVGRVFAAKGRPTTHPLIVHVLDLAAAEHWWKDTTPLARTLAEKFWPGPLTIVAEKADHVSAVVTGGQSTVAVRSPDHSGFRTVLNDLAGHLNEPVGLVAPSANRFGKVSPTSATAAAADLSAHLTAEDVILDGGPCRIGLESTVVVVSDTGYNVARPGAISVHDLEEASGIHPSTPDSRGSTPPQGSLPGTLASHYAPDARVVLWPRPADLRNLNVDEGVSLGLVGLRSDVEQCLRLTPPSLIASETLTDADDTHQLAHGLYAALRRADELGLDVVLAIAPSAGPMAEAISDRMKRAATTIEAN